MVLPSVLQASNGCSKLTLVCQKEMVINVTQSEPGRRLKSLRVRIDNKKLWVDC